MQVPYFPIPSFGKYTTWMTPSVGSLDGIWARALALQDAAGTHLIFLSIDGIGADRTLMRMAYEIALQEGLQTPIDNMYNSQSNCKKKYEFL